MVADVAHANPDTFAETLALARRPVVDSHTGLQAFHGQNTHPDLMARLLSDGHLRDLAATGGVACIDFVPDHLVDRGDPPRDVTMNDLIAVIRHAVEVAGIDHVGLGSDWDGFGGSAVVGLEDASRLPSLVEALLASGFSERETAKIVGGNLRRVFDEVLPP
jgi:microsomal dipeptidase-like Zn-dependent dipeptidase